MSWPNDAVHLPAAAWHGATEWFSGHVSDSEAVYEAQVAAGQLWLQFQDMLKKAREKEQAARNGR